MIILHQKQTVLNTISAHFPRLWAALPVSVRDQLILHDNMRPFKSHLKTYFFEKSIEELELDS